MIKKPAGLRALIYLGYLIEVRRVARRPVLACAGTATASPD